MHYVTYALLFVIWAGLACLFFYMKKVIFLANVKAHLFPQAEENVNSHLYSRRRNMLCSSKVIFT